MSSFTVHDAGLALRAGHPQKASDFAAIVAQLRHHTGDKQPLQHYLELVRDEPGEWLRRFPPSWSSERMFQRGRAAINTLCKLDEVAEAMREAGAVPLIGEVLSTLKGAMTGDAIRELLATRAAAGAAETPDDDLGRPDPLDLADEGLFLETPAAHDSDRVGPVDETRRGRLAAALEAAAEGTTLAAVLARLSPAGDPWPVDEQRALKAIAILLEAPPADCAAAFRALFCGDP